MSKQKGKYAHLAEKVRQDAQNKPTKNEYKRPTEQRVIGKEKQN